MKLIFFTVAIRRLYGLLPPKLLMVMKLTTFLLLTVLLQASAKSFGQVTLNEQNVPLEKILKSIKKQTGYAVFYDYNQIQDVKVSIQVTNVSVDQALAICCKDLPVSFEIIDNNITLKKKDESFLSKLLDAVRLPIDIHGTVTDENGPIAGVTVHVKGRAQLTATDETGKFRLSVNVNDILVFTYVGYKTQEVIVKDDTPLKIRLEKDIALLDQVAVVGIGYGTVQKKDLTGSVSVVDVQDVQDVPFGTIDNALAGKAAGVEVTKTDGSPGGAVRIRIRGSSSILGGNDPLYVIDGVPVEVQSNYLSPGYDIPSPTGNALTNNQGAGGGLSGGSLATAFVNGLNSLGGLNVDDIESISILKDASSTAIYGSKAANGVVIITTKKGKKDMKPVITASYYSTVSTAITPDVLDAAQYRLLVTEAAQNDADERNAAGDALPPNTSAILNDPSSYFGAANTNWIKDVTRTTVADNAELAVQGGGNSSSYFNSISYNSTPGVVDGTDYQRVSGKINLENGIGPRFRFITNVILGYTNQDIGDGAYMQAIKARPDYAPYDASGNYVNFSTTGNSGQNPLALVSATNNAKTTSLIGSISAIYDITKALQFKSTASLNMQDYNQRNYTPSYLETVDFYAGNASNDGIGSNSNSRLTDWFLENTLTYNKKLDKNNTIDLLAGTSYETTKASFFTATAGGYPNDNVLTSLSSAVTPLYVSGDEPSMPQSYLLSFYVRANYSYKDKYLLTFTGRSDGSSKFGPNNKFGYFPSGAIAWRISQENFLKDIKWIDDIKLRGSYGLTGNQNIGNQMYRTLYSPYSYAGSSALVPTQLGDEGIKWESTNEADGGIDISLFENRLSATVDYYNKQTNGALLSLPVVSSSSYSSVLSNAAGIKNTGVEVSLQGDIIRTNIFKWSASVNLTWNNSLVTRLDANADLTQIGDLTGLEYGNTALIQGKPLGLITGYTVTGIIKTQEQLDAYKAKLGYYAAYLYPYLGIGDPMYKLTTTSPTDNAPDYNTIIANAAPKYFGGITQSFSYKKFDLQFYFTFSEGGKLLWSDHITSVEFNGTSNADVSILSRYTPSNTNTDEPRLILNDEPYYKSNLDVFSSSYLKLRTLTLNYHFYKSPWMQKAGLKTAELFASATNLFTITKYPGPDPEISDDPYSVNGGYFDASNYPTVRTWSIGFKAGF